ncbi:preprotein translocase subunit YajC [Neisseriaceae bacterium ESL0693]|nr:preprotein translocase subunit YajC [Neisseriaceae bacterium ESL0693]
MIDFAYAADAGGTSSTLMQFLPILLILVVFYFLIMRPQQAKMKKHQQMIAELKKGDKVITSSGIAGKITKVGEQFFTVEIAPNVEVEFERNAISGKIQN